MPPITRFYESYVNPNASCPVCGASVYFYQSPHGGRVFFDELGYPWPKHPCTGNSSIPKQIAATRIQRDSKTFAAIYTWQKAGWQPFFISIIARIDKYLLKILGKMGEEELTLYAKSTLVRHGQARDITSDCIAQIRRSDPERYEISIITTVGTAATFNIYTSQIAARKDSGRRDTKWLFSTATSKAGANNSNENSVPASKGKDASDASPRSALATAYAKALSKKSEST